MVRGYISSVLAQKEWVWHPDLLFRLCAPLLRPRLTSTDCVLSPDGTPSVARGLCQPPFAEKGSLVFLAEALLSHDPRSSSWATASWTQRHSSRVGGDCDSVEAYSRRHLHVDCFRPRAPSEEQASSSFRVV